MTFDYRTSRIAKILVDSSELSFSEVQEFLKAQTVEIVVGNDATSPAAHAAVLTAVATSSRAFLGGVRISGATSQPVNCRLPVEGETIGAAAGLLGANGFDGEPGKRICIGTPPSTLRRASFAWWNSWRAGSSTRPKCSRWTDNSLVGICAGALAVASSFESAKSGAALSEMEIDLWPEVESVQPPQFAEVYLPNGLWIFGLGNLGQAFLWSLASLPYAPGRRPVIFLQDYDRISEENWGTSILVNDDSLGALKTRIAEDWALKREFVAHRIDRKLSHEDKRRTGEPSIALCGFDNVDARLFLGNAEFPVIIDAGLGRRARAFDEFRVTVFDKDYGPNLYFSPDLAKEELPAVPTGAAYEELEEQLGDCGAAEIAGASVAIPHVSAIAAAVAISRAIAVVSKRPLFRTETRKLTRPASKRRTPILVHSRELIHGGRPVETK